ncbi:MAG: hypothetical protein ABR570_16575, partial [Burkholderiales bacterium]
MLKALLTTLVCSLLIAASTIARAADAAIAIVSHEVADFSAWKKSFDSGKEPRKKAGVTAERYVMRDADKPNHVIVVLEFNSL